MNKKLLTTILTAGFIATSTLMASAAETTSATLTATLAASSSVTTDKEFEALTIDAATGNLSNNGTADFTITTNDANGVTVTFEATDSTGGQNLLTGSSSATSGKVLLINEASNSGNGPANSAINDALSSSPTAANNANVIGYGISVQPKGSADAPVLNSKGDAFEVNLDASQESFTVNVDSLSKANTFNYLDESGSYQMTITCSVSGS